MDTSYTQFCLEQMGIPVWVERVTQGSCYAVLKNRQGEVVGHLLLGEKGELDGPVRELVVAMLKAIDLRIGEFEKGLPDEGQAVGVVLRMGEVECGWVDQYARQYQIVHPVEILENPGLKREAWHILKRLKSEILSFSRDHGDE